MKVLFIDDDPDLLRQAEIFLEREDKRLDVDTVSSAEEGLEMMDRTDYDVVVSDYKMSEMDGFEFLETVREDRNSDIPFIVFTGRGSEEVAMEALNLGADRYVMKGGDVRLQFEDLADAIAHAIFKEVSSPSESYGNISRKNESSNTLNGEQ